MSSEMRELLAEMREDAKGFDQWGSTYWADRLEDILARTEAGADGAVPFCYVLAASVETLTGEVNFLCNKERQTPEDTPLHTHPQDASGDAERYRFLRENHSEKWEDAETHTQFSCSIDFAGQGHDIDAAIDAAMQAKEAK